MARLEVEMRMRVAHVVRIGHQRHSTLSIIILFFSRLQFRELRRMGCAMYVPRMQSSIKAFSLWCARALCWTMNALDSVNNNNIILQIYFFRMSEEFLAQPKPLSFITMRNATHTIITHAINVGIIIQFHAYSTAPTPTEHQTKCSENKFCNKIVDAEVFARASFGRWFVLFSCTFFSSGF